MKKLSLFLTPILMVVAMLGCKSTTTQVIAPPANQVGTLQGKVMDALTGAAIGGDLKMTLIQGSQERGPDKLHTDPNDPLLGEYAFASIPVDITLKNEIRFKVVVIKTGYQRFEADVLIAGSPNGTGTLNSIVNVIGNIYLFPLGSSAGDVSVFVQDPQGTPVPNAVVLLQQDILNNNVISKSTSSTIPDDRLVPAGGLYSSLTATTDSNGSAVFSGSKLTLGGSYSIVVQALTFQGQQLQTLATPAFKVGVAPASQVVALSNATGLNSLFATFASNQAAGTITSSGILTVNFNQPVILSPATFTAAISSGALAATTVTGALSNNDTTLTLTPSIATPPTAAGTTVTYTYAGAIFLKNSQALTGLTLFTGAATDIVNISTGGPVSGVVQVTGN